MRRQLIHAVALIIALTSSQIIFATPARAVTLPIEPAPLGTDKNPPLVNGAVAGISVITSTGTLSLSATDVAIAGRGPSPLLTRTYNSNDTRIGPLGPGWTHSYAMHLADPGDGSSDVIFVGSQGRSDRYTFTAGTYTPRPGVQTTLVKNPDSTYTLTAKNQTVADFDTQGRLTRLRDRYGNSSTLSYDPSGRLQSVSDPAGRGSLTFTHDGSGRLTTVRDWFIREIRYTYDGSGRLASVQDRENAVTSFTYDPAGRLATIRDPNNNTVLTVSYDPQGRVASEKDAAGLISGAQVTFSYGPSTTTATYPASSFDGYQAVVTDSFDPNGWLLRRDARPTVAELATTLYSYDTNGNLTTVTDPRGNLTTYCYDVAYDGTPLTPARANLTRVIRPAAFPDVPAVSLARYDSKNNLVEAVSPLGVMNGASVTCTTPLAGSFEYTTTYQYDPAQTLLLSVATRFLDPDLGLQNAITSYEYGDPANPGRVTRVNPPSGPGHAVTATYGSFGPGAGMVTSVSDAYGNTVTYEYDPLGRVTGVVAPSGPAHRTTYEYDREDRLRFTRLPAPRIGLCGSTCLQQLVTEHRYDFAGNRTMTIDANGQAVGYVYDSRSLLWNVRECAVPMDSSLYCPSSSTTNTMYSYDNLGMLRTVERSGGGAPDTRRTELSYDGLMRLRTERQLQFGPPDLITAYEYDPSGNLSRRTDPLGRVTTFLYDALDRNVVIDYGSWAPRVTYTYDRSGGRTSMQDGEGTTTYTLDQLGRPTAITTPTPTTRTVGYRYDPDGNRRRLIYPDGTQVNYTYDNAGRLSSVSDWLGRTTTYTYTPDSSIDQAVMSFNNTSRKYVYDDARRLVRVDQLSGPTMLLRTDYGLDGVGNRTRVEEVRGQVGASNPMSWGNNDAGQLGDGTTTNRDVPVAISGLVGSVSMYAVGDNHSLSVGPCTPGTTCIQAWGRNDWGQLGDGTITNRSTPVVVVCGAGDTACLEPTKVSAGGRHSMALLRDGTVRTWGANYAGQLGEGTTQWRTTPTTVSGLASVTQVSAGWSHSLALKSDGTVWSWGANERGQLGDGTTTQRLAPVQVKGVGGVGYLTGIVYISAGRDHNLALGSDGTVYAWGAGDFGQLGNGIAADSTTPIVVLTSAGGPPLSGVALVQAGRGTGIGGGWRYSVALKSDGTVWAWGDNTYGELGDGTFNWRLFPVQSGGPSFTGVAALGAGADHVAALKSDGTVWTWGQHNAGQLGRPATHTCLYGYLCSPNPAQVAGLAKIAGIASWGDHTLVTSALTTVTTYTYDRLYRLLGDGTSTYTYDPYGNRTSLAAGGAPTTYSYDRTDRITAVGATTYVVDGAGNLIARGADTFSYDGADRLTQAAVAGVTGTYAYDGDGVRVRKTLTAFPQVQSITVTDFPSNSTGHAVSMPATVSADDLLVILLATDGGPSFTTPPGWTSLGTAGTADSKVARFARKADGTEDGTTVNVLTSEGEKGRAHVYRITGWNKEGTLATAGTAIQVSSTTGGSSANPDPGAFDPTQWDVEKTLWIAVFIGEYATTVTGYPASYSGGTGGSAANPGGVTIGSAHRENAVAAEDPGTFTQGTGQAWIAFTVAVRPLPVSAQTTSYLHDTAAGLPVLLDDGARKYVWGQGLLYAVDASGAVVAHEDGLTSVRALTDSSGALQQTYTFDAFGAPRQVEGPSTQPFSFSGEVRDTETGFIYLRARYYDPVAGRFISRDPLAGVMSRSQSQNRYAYAANNPVTMRDPSGLIVVYANGVAYDLDPGTGTLTLVSDGPTPVEKVPGDGSNCPLKNCGAWNDPNGPGGGQGGGAGGGGGAPVVLGQAGEAVVRTLLDIGPKTAFVINGVSRIADGLNRATGIISEVKNTSYQAFTSQIRDYVAYAQQEGLQFDLWLRGGTRLSGPLEAAYDSGYVNIIWYELP